MTGQAREEEEEVHGQAYKIMQSASKTSMIAHNYAGAIKPAMAAPKIM